MFHSIFRMVVQVKQMSGKDRLKREKYTGLWRRELVIIAKMMRRFPMKVTRYMNWKSQKRRDCSNTCSESHGRINSKIRV